MAILGLPHPERRPDAIGSPALVVLSLVVLSCGGGDEKSAEEQYAERYARAKCDVLSPCCEENGLSFDEDGCVVGGAGFVQSGADLAEQHGAVFDEATADACIRATVELTRSCTPTKDSAGALSPCGRVWSGTNSPGTACTIDHDCAPSEEGRGACYITSEPGDETSGVCVIRKSPASVGDVCAATGTPPMILADCAASDLRCDLATGTCQPLVQLGGACGGFTRCVRGAYCDETNTCVAALGAGTDCQANDECESGLCLRGACAENDLGSIAPCTGVSE